MISNPVDQQWLKTYLESRSIRHVIDLSSQVKNLLDEAAEKYNCLDVMADVSMTADMKVTIDIFPDPEEEPV